LARKGGTGSPPFLIFEAIKFFIPTDIDIIGSKVKPLVIPAKFNKSRNKILPKVLVRERTAKLENKTQNLEELNTAMKVLLKRLETEKEELEEKVLTNVEQLVMPYIEKLKKSRLKEKEADYVNILESNLKEIVSPFSKKLSAICLNLTPKEIQIANLIKEDKTTKEIAEILNTSPGTVDFHRSNLRRKLNIKSKRTNLKSYLMTLS
jgi:ATP/maltotriose-dependent transcriptional regulator MalT